jgi:hypothetical protein
MEHVTGSTTLATRLQTIRKITDQFAKEYDSKSEEQLIAEIDFIKGLLDETKSYLTKNNNPIL